jgi:hypothetical protein
MDERKYRSYAKEFKLDALELLKRGDQSAGEIERQLGITPGVPGTRFSNQLDKKFNWVAVIWKGPRQRFAACSVSCRRQRRSERS